MGSTHKGLSQNVRRPAWTLTTRARGKIRDLRSVLRGRKKICHRETLGNSFSRVKNRSGCDGVRLIIFFEEIL
jgi:hypothetical protein